MLLMWPPKDIVFIALGAVNESNPLVWATYTSKYHHCVIPILSTTAFAAFYCCFILFYSMPTLSTLTLSSDLPLTNTLQLYHHGSCSHAYSTTTCGTAFAGLSSSSSSSSLSKLLCVSSWSSSQNTRYNSCSPLLPLFIIIYYYLLLFIIIYYHLFYSVFFHLFFSSLIFFSLLPAYC